MEDAIEEMDGIEIDGYLMRVFEDTGPPGPGGGGGGGAGGGGACFNCGKEGCSKKVCDQPLRTSGVCFAFAKGQCFAKQCTFRHEG